MSKTPRNLVRSSALLAVTVVLAGCPRPPDPDDDFRREVLAAAANHVVLPHLRQFEAAAVSLEQTTSALVTAAAAGPATEERGAAQAAWSAAMDVWQRAEPHQLGPGGPPATFTGGGALRDQLYSWPTTNACRVDIALVEERYLSQDFFTTELVDVYGLDVLEYLLFHTAPENQCPPLSEINASGTWDALSADELLQRRAAYADAVAGQLVRDAQALLAAWAPEGENFAGALAAAGEGEGSPFGTAQMALDELFAAMFYLDLVVKDAKLAVPAGLSPDCSAETCPSDVESRWAGRSNQHLVANLEGFRAIFLGNLRDAPEQPGFDNFLTRRNAADLSTQILSRTDEAIAAVEAIPAPLELAVDAHPTEVAAAHAAIKAVTDLLKTQFVTVLNLRVPQEGAADND